MSQQVLNTGFDPTSATSISGAQLAQMVSGATFAFGVGGIIVTTDSTGTPNIPNASSDTTLQTYIWLRIGAVNVSAYLWNPNIGTDPTYLKWQSLLQASIGVGTVTGGTNGNIAPSTITPYNVSYIEGSQLVGSLSASTLVGLIQSTTVAGGVLSGTFGALTYAVSQATLAIFNALTNNTNKATPVGADGVMILDSAAVASPYAKYTTMTQMFATFLPTALGALSYKTALSSALATSAAQILASGAHGLTSPVRAEVFLQCVTNDSATGYVVGDVIPYNQVIAAEGTLSLQCGFNGTNVWINQGSITLAAFLLTPKGGGVLVAASALANFKAYAIVYAY